ncbi:MAG: hypothetical protein RML45_12450 [Acetobacteraceae bacterium]|nr:hypothetical protein [Acetobacteraceae bacterium]
MNAGAEDFDLGHVRHAKRARTDASTALCSSRREKPAAVKASVMPKVSPKSSSEEGL